MLPDKNPYLLAVTLFYPLQTTSSNLSNQNLLSILLYFLILNFKYYVDFHIIYGLLQLVSFAYCFPQGSSKLWHVLILHSFYGWIIFHHINTWHLTFTFIHLMCIYTFFHLLAMNNAAINISVHKCFLCEHMPSYLLDI